MIVTNMRKSLLSPMISLVCMTAILISLAKRLVGLLIAALQYMPHHGGISLHPTLRVSVEVLEWVTMELPKLLDSEMCA